MLAKKFKRRIIIIILFIFVCITSSTPTKAIYRQTKTKSFSLTILKPSYKLKFDKNTGTGSMEDQTIKYGVTTNINVNTFTKTGYKFMGWNTDPSGNGTAYTNYQSISNLSSTNGETITLYAQWQRVMAENIEYHNNELNCNDVQCMIDELYEMLY